MSFFRSRPRARALSRSRALARSYSDGSKHRAGDAVIGDQDGVVVVPAAVAQEVYDIAHSREVIEGIIKEQLEKEKCPPGKYYPFVSGKIKVKSPPAPRDDTCQPLCLLCMACVIPCAPTSVMST